MPDARLHEPARRGGGAREHPFIPTRQNGQKRGNIRRQRDSAAPVHLVFDGQAFPLEIDVSPFERGQFFAARSGQQQGLQIRGVNGVLQIADVLKPKRQLLTLQTIIFCGLLW